MLKVSFKLIQSFFGLLVPLEPIIFLNSLKKGRAHSPDLVILLTPPVNDLAQSFFHNLWFTHNVVWVFIDVVDLEYLWLCILQESGGKVCSADLSSEIDRF